MTESSLHRHLKQFYLQDGGLAEWWIDGYLIDVYKDDTLIEIQTGNFGAIRLKLEKLLDHYPIQVTLPIQKEKVIILKDRDYSFVHRRRSPKKGRFEHLFYELVSIVSLVSHPNFSLEVLLTSEEEVRIADGRGSWRRNGVSIQDRRLVGILERACFSNPADYAVFIPPILPEHFTNQELAAQINVPRRLASKMTYCLTAMGLIVKAGKKGNATLFRKNLKESNFYG